jgi:hypothetical protein
VTPVSARKLRGWSSAGDRRREKWFSSSGRFAIDFEDLPGRTFRAGFHAGRFHPRHGAPAGRPPGPRTRMPLRVRPVASIFACSSWALPVQTCSGMARNSGPTLAGTLSPAVRCSPSPENCVGRGMIHRFIRRIRNGDRTGPGFQKANNHGMAIRFPLVSKLERWGRAASGRRSLSVKLQRAPKDGPVPQQTAF